MQLRSTQLPAEARRRAAATLRRRCCLNASRPQPPSSFAPWGSAAGAGREARLAAKAALPRCRLRLQSGSQALQPRRLHQLQLRRKQHWRQQQ